MLFIPCRAGFGQLSQGSVEGAPWQDSVRSNASRLDSMSMRDTAGGPPIGLSHPLPGSSAMVMQGFGLEESWGAHGGYLSRYS